MEAPADGFGDIAHWDAFFGHRMIFRARFVLFKRKPVKAGDIRDMRRCPAVAPFSHIGGDALLAGNRDRRSDEALFDRVVNLGKTHDRSANALQRQSRLFRNAREWEIRRNVVIFGGNLARPG